MNPTYIQGDPYELLEKSSPFIKELFTDGVPDVKASEIGELLKIPVESYNALSNLISFILVGAILPADIHKALLELVGVTEEEALHIEKELETSVLQKVREVTLGKTTEKDAVATLTFKKEDATSKKTAELRSEILDTTKREQPKPKEPLKKDQKGPPTPANGSRNQLMEQLQLLGSIPNDEEVETRLKKIQDQITNLKVKEETVLITVNGETKEVTTVTNKVKMYDFGENSDKAVQARVKTATYSTAPTHYNVDPYREVAEE
jgi:hypothetical protein